MGYGVIEVLDHEHKALEWGTIQTDPKAALASRLRVLYDGMSEVLNRFEPNIVAFERLIYVQNAQSAMALGQARGVAILAANQKKLDVVEYSPKEVKKTISGRGNAGKEQVTQMVKILLGLRGEDISSDAGDALGIAMTHALASKRQNLLRQNAGKE